MEDKHKPNREEVCPSKNKKDKLVQIEPCDRIAARPVFWRSLQELSRSEDFEDVLRDEFPRQAMALDNGVDRRDFVKLMSASMALAGLTACNRPAEKIVPYVRQPENIIPGKPLFFASAMPLGGIGTGGAILLGVLVVVAVLGVLTLFGRRRQRRAQAERRAGG